MSNIYLELFDHYFHLLKSRAYPLIPSTLVTFFCWTDKLGSYSFSFIALFLDAKDFCRFSYLSLLIYSNLGVNFLFVVITALSNSSGNCCSSKGLFLSLLARTSTQFLSRELKWRAMLHRSYMHQKPIHTVENQQQDTRFFHWKKSDQTFFDLQSNHSRRKVSKVEYILLNIQLNHQDRKSPI